MRGFSRFLLAAGLVVGSFATAFTPGTLAAHAATVNGSRADVKACGAVYHFHHVDVTPALYGDEAVYQGAYRAAWQLAGKADPGLRADVRHYLRTDRGWSWVAGDCTEVMLPEAS